jgi:hypothetical protein
VVKTWEFLDTRLTKSASDEVLLGYEHKTCAHLHNPVQIFGLNPGSRATHLLTDWPSLKLTLISSPLTANRRRVQSGDCTEASHMDRHVLLDRRCDDGNRL